MRKIKFRGKDIDTKEWTYGSLCKVADQCKIAMISTFETECSGYITEVDSESVGQFTGLVVKNGKEIYEGDIITLNGRYPRVVLWDKMSWALMPTEYYHDEVFWVMNLQHPGNDWWEEFANEFEVIGNIYDNPELLKGGKQ